MQNEDSSVFDSRHARIGRANRSHPAARSTKQRPEVIEASRQKADAPADLALIGAAHGTSKAKREIVHDDSIISEVMIDTP
jgi:hypothetical protein